MLQDNYIHLSVRSQTSDAMSLTQSSRGLWLAYISHKPESFIGQWPTDHYP